jgi:hypothetical protein
LGDGNLWKEEIKKVRLVVIYILQCWKVHCNKCSWAGEGMLGLVFVCLLSFWRSLSS